MGYLINNSTEPAFQATENPLVFWNSCINPLGLATDFTDPMFPPSNMWNPDTSSFWLGEEVIGSPISSSQVVQMNNSFAGAKINYIAMAGHNLGSNINLALAGSDAWTVSAQRFNGSAWDTLGTSGPIFDNSPIVFLFNTFTGVNSFRFLMNRSVPGSIIVAPKIAHVKMGIATKLERKIYLGHEPNFGNTSSFTSANLSQFRSQVKVKNIINSSDTGKYLGQIVLREYRNDEIKQTTVSYSHYRDDIIPFLNHCQGVRPRTNTLKMVADSAPTTFFYCWRPNTFGGDVTYGWAADIDFGKIAKQVIAASNAIVHGIDWGMKIGAVD